MFPRRSFLALAAATAIPTRKAKVELLFDTPGAQPNGLQATAEGLWVLDQKDNKAYLLKIETGAIVRSFATASNAGSGITFDGQALWLSSTYACRILRVDAHTGATLGDFPSPGTGPVKWARPRVSARTAPRQPAPALVPNPVSGLPRPTAITGAHGLEWRNGRLYVASPPSRTLYRIDPGEGHFLVDHMFPTAGDRPHGLGWQGDSLWCADTNQNAFHKMDPVSGKVIESIQLADADPPPHGMTIWDGWMYWADADSRAVCRLKL